MSILRRLSKKFSSEKMDPVPTEDSGDKGDVYLRGEFMAMDSDNTGVISTNDFVNLLRYLGVPSVEKIKSLLKEVNEDESSTVTIDEYYQALESHPEVMQSTSRLRDMFKKFDLNGDGQAYKKDIVEGFREMGVEIDDEIKDKIDKLDHNRDGKVKYQDFLRAQLEQRKIIPLPK